MFFTQVNVYMQIRVDGKSLAGHVKLGNDVLKNLGIKSATSVHNITMYVADAAWKKLQNYDEGKTFKQYINLNCKIL